MSAQRQLQNPNRLGEGENIPPPHRRLPVGLARRLPYLLILAGALTIGAALASPKLKEPFWVFNFPSDAGIVVEGIPVKLTGRVFNPHLSELAIESRPAGCLAVEDADTLIKVPPLRWATVEFTFESSRISEGPAEHLATFVGTLAGEPVEVRVPFRFYAKKGLER